MCVCGVVVGELSVGPSLVSCANELYRTKRKTIRQPKATDLSTLLNAIARLEEKSTPSLSQMDRKIDYIGKRLIDKGLGTVRTVRCTAFT